MATFVVLGIGVFSLALAALIHNYALPRVELMPLGEQTTSGAAFVLLALIGSAAPPLTVSLGEGLCKRRAAKPRRGRL